MAVLGCHRQTGHLLTILSRLLLLTHMTGYVLGAPASNAPRPNDDDSGLIVSERHSLDFGLLELVPDRSAHRTRSPDVSYSPIFTVLNWQPIEPSSKALVAISAMMEGVQKYLSASREGSFASGSRLSLSYGRIGVTVTIVNALDKRDRHYDHRPTTKEIMLDNLRDLLKGFVEGFFGFGNFIWDYKGWGLLSIVLVLLDGIAQQFDDLPYEFGDRHLA